MQNLLEDLKKVLSQDQNYILEGKLFKNKIIEDALKANPALIKLLLNNKTIKNHFFTKIDEVLVFDKIKFQDFVSNEEFLPSSYTKFKNHIGLSVGDKFFSSNKEVSLAWPYKDCLLEGGQSKDDEGRDEIFYNEILSPDEISLLLEPKVLASFELWDEKAVARLWPARQPFVSTHMENIIEVKNITKHFPGVVANDNISLEIRRGEIYAICCR